MAQKFECIEQLFDDEYYFDPKALLLSFEAYLGRQAVVGALEYISRVEDWSYIITENGEIIKNESED